MLAGSPLSKSAMKGIRLEAGATFFQPDPFFLLKMREGNYDVLQVAPLRVNDVGFALLPLQDPLKPKFT